MMESNLWNYIKTELRRITYINDQIDKKQAALRIKDNIPFEGPNAWILAFSVVIASVGLNINSTAVIIGAMLISPLMGPIIGMGFSLGTNDAPLLRRAFRNYITMVIISLLAAVFFFLLSPLKLVNPTELEARTSPTIYDVIIAFFGGLAGIFENCRKDKGTVLSGVAIATALMPPLCTAGYGLAHGDMHFFVGAMYLFIINTVFIMLATYVGVVFLRFNPAEHVEPEMRKRWKRISTIVVVAIMVPSIFSAFSIVRNNNFERSVESFVEAHKRYGKSFLYDYKIVSGRDRKAEIHFAGQPISAEAMEDLLLEAEKNYGLRRGQIEISAIHFGGADDEQMRDIIRGINDRSESEIASRDSRIRELETQLDNTLEEEIPYEQLAREIRYKYPAITDVTIARGKNVTTDSLKVSPRINVITSSKDALKAKELAELEAWLRMRMSDTTVVVLGR